MGSELAGDRALLASTNGCDGGAYTLRKPLFRDGRIADVDQLATTGRNSCRLDKGDWPVLVTDFVQRMRPSSTPARRYSWSTWLGSFGSVPSFVARSRPDTIEPGGLLWRFKRRGKKLEKQVSPLQAS